MPFLKKIAFLFFSLITLTASAQWSEVGIFLGASRYKGELSPQMFDIKFNHPSAGVFFRRNRTRHWSWKLEFNYGRVSGDDARLKTGYEINRNLNFYSDIFEVTYAFEFNFFPFETGNNAFPFAPYLFSGLTSFYFNPTTELNGEKIRLQPLGTEGQGMSGRESPYHRISFAIPLGGGFKINTGNVSIALLVSARRTYTDYLDDVSTTYPNIGQMIDTKGPVAAYLSDPGLLRDTALALNIRSGKQRGDPTYNDWYIFAGFNVFVRLTNYHREFCRPFKRKRY
jgi:hypothetical protein